MDNPKGLVTLLDGSVGPASGVLRVPFQQFKRGWFVGNFSPTVYPLAACEVGYLRYRQGESWPYHYQQTATEINYLVQGRLSLHFLDATVLTFFAGELFVIPPGKTYAARPIFHTDCELVCVKIPSQPGDKVEC